MGESPDWKFKISAGRNWSRLTMMDTSRQSTLIKDQKKLEKVKVLIIGCGAIGSQVAQILVRMGVGSVGKITLADGDNVESSNLNRQFFGADHVGQNKAVATSLQLKAVNPDICVETMPFYLKLEDLELSDYDVVVFAADSLYLEGKFYNEILKLKTKDQPVFLSPRMNAWACELFVRIPGVTEPDGIYFNDKPDKDYKQGANCTNPTIQEKKIASIATTTTLISGLTAQAFVHAVMGWPCKSHLKIDFRQFFEKV